MPPPGTFGLWTKINPGFFNCFCQLLCHSKEQRSYCMFVFLSSTGISYTSVLGNLYKTITWPDHLPVARADAGTPHWSSAAFKLTWVTTLPSFSSCVLSPVNVSCPFFFKHQHLHRLLTLGWEGYETNSAEMLDETVPPFDCHSGWDGSSLWLPSWVLPRLVKVSEKRNFKLVTVSSFIKRGKLGTLIIMQVYKYKGIGKSLR